MSLLQVFLLGEVLRTPVALVISCELQEVVQFGYDVAIRRLVGHSGSPGGLIRQHASGQS